jgi:hypothetical protein
VGLAEFLAARLNDDEEYARTVQRAAERHAEAATDPQLKDMAALALPLLTDPSMLRLMSRVVDSKVAPPNDLKRVLREVDVKRKILADIVPELERWAAFVDGEYNSYPDYDGDALLKMLAAVYQDHPDYDRAWKE